MIQAGVRGWLVRRTLACAGPGVLKRSILVNDEDVFTYETKDRQYPLDYFAFEENGKVWWFAFTSFWIWCSRSHAPVNPYTKTPLSTEVLDRLWSYWGMRMRMRIPLPEESSTYEDRLHQRWNILSRIFSGYGFESVHPMNFLDMTKTDYHAVFSLLKPDLEVVFPVSDPFRNRAILFCTRNMNSARALQSNQYILQSVYTLMILLSLHKSSYTMAFVILSALHRC